MSVQADETTDSAMHVQLSIIIRYAYEDKTCERFLGSYEVSVDKSATRLADVIATALNSFSHATDKLAGKIFDILQCKLLDIKHGQSKLSDSIHCAEGYRMDEHYENILRNTAAVIEQADESDPSLRK
ncbi:Hypothetical predicted protein [Octopus vulgaris]|uniref:Uncharacterized protein n=1 Tax=Octopus vulgaris TaxID=6645 RepID=A0AA36F3R9_OCTVU|nr:Hypothetical predicted protein [Octopus vulgaris]